MDRGYDTTVASVLYSFDGSPYSFISCVRPLTAVCENIHTSTRGCVHVHTHTPHK